MADRWVKFALLAGMPCLVSSGFVSYWPIGIFQAFLVFLTLLLLRQERNVSFLLSGVFLIFSSFLVGALLVYADWQLIMSWKMGLYVLVHVAWLFVFLREFQGGGYSWVMRVFVVFVVFAISLVNAGNIAESQNEIAFLEVLLFVLAVFFYGCELFVVRKMLVWFLLVIGALVLSNATAIQDEVGLADWWRVFQIAAHFLFAMVILVWLRKEYAALACLSMAVGGAVIVYVVAFLLAWFGMHDPSGFDWFYNPPLFAHIRHVGYFLCVAVVVCAWGVLTAHGRVRVLVWTVYALAWTILLWSGGRGAFLSSVFGMLLLLPMAPLSRYGRHWAWLLIGVLLGLLISMLFFVEQHGMGWVSALGRSGAADSLNAMSSSRLMIWEHLFGFIVERFLLGWGGEGFLAVWTGFPINQAHNAVFQIFVEWGLLGALIIGVPLVGLTLHGFKEYISGSGCERRLRGFGMSLVSALLVFSMVDGIFYYGLPLAFLVVGYTALLGKGA